MNCCSTACYGPSINCCSYLCTYDRCSLFPPCTPYPPCPYPSDPIGPLWMQSIHKENVRRIAWDTTNTQVPGYDTATQQYVTVDLVSDGVTLDMSHLDHFIVTPITPGITIKGLIFFLDFHADQARCADNEFHFVLGVYEAPKGSKRFTRIPDSTLDYGTISMPPTWETHMLLDRNVGIPISAEKDYAFALHYTRKATAPENCLIYAGFRGGFNY